MHAILPVNCTATVTGHGDKPVARGEGAAESGLTVMGPEEGGVGSKAKRQLIGLREEDVSRKPALREEQGSPAVPPPPPPDHCIQLFNGGTPTPLPVLPPSPTVPSFTPLHLTLWRRHL